MIRYCRACEVGELRGYPELARALDDRSTAPEVVYLWEDHTVTDLPLTDAEPFFASDSPPWHEFCAGLLATNAQG